MANQSLDSVNKRIRARTYEGPNAVNDLAREICSGLAALSRQPSFVRGLKNGVISDVQGGTTLGVGDPSAANISGGLVQNAQPGLPRNSGAGMLMRRQARIELRTRDVPAMVVTNAVYTDETIRVKLVATTPFKGTDSATMIEVVGDPLGNMADAGMAPDDLTGVEIDAKVTGEMFSPSGDAGIQPPVAGQTIFVTLVEQWEIVTTLSRRYRKNVPTVTRVLKERTATVTNGLVNLVST